MLRLKEHSTAVLFVHGIQGGPRQFQWMVDQLPEGTTFINGTLPGHGGGVTAFRRSGIRDWQEYVNQQAIKLCRQYERVVFVGHSMGCLLGIEAIRHPQIRFSSMLLLACPLSLRPTWAYFRNSVLAAANYRGNNPYVLSVKEANSVRASFPGAYLTCVHPYMELLRLIRAVRREGRQELTGRAVFFEKDEIVGKRSIQLAETLFGVKTILLPACGHDYFPPEAREKMLELLKESL